jgi:hypothetical protein
VGVISRYPLRAPADQRHVPGQLLQVDIGAQPVTLINANLTAPDLERGSLPLLPPALQIYEYDTADRVCEVEALLDIIEEMQGPLVILGDFNMSDREPAYRHFAAHLHDAYRETAGGFGFTYPIGAGSAPFPLVRIDYVWSGGGVAPAAAQVACFQGWWDHCTLLAELRVGAAQGGAAPTAEHAAITARRTQAHPLFRPTNAELQHPNHRCHSNAG